MPYGLRTRTTNEIDEQARLAGGVRIDDPASFQLGYRRNVGKVLVFCHPSPEGPHKKLVVIVDNAEDQRAEIKLNAFEYVIAVRSYGVKFIEEATIRVETAKEPAEKEVFYWV
jgi:hypothetical protein